MAGIVELKLALLKQSGVEKSCPRPLTDKSKWSCMPRFHFYLRDGARGVSDPEGTDLPGDTAAKAYATQVAGELMRQAEVKRRHWQLDVSDDTGKVLFHVPFAAVDITIDHLALTTRGLVERL